MAFVVDLGSFETRCGFSDEFAPCYTHRSVASSSIVTSSRGPYHQYSYGTTAVERQYSHSNTSSNFQSLPSSSFASSSSASSFPSMWSPSAVAAGGDVRALLSHHVEHVYEELTSAAVPIAFRRRERGGGGPMATDLAPIPFHFVVPEAFFAGGTGAGSPLASMAEVVLERDACPAMYLSRPSVMATLASGRASAIILDVGHSQSTATVVVDGVALRGAQQSSTVGGAAVNASLLELLAAPSARPLAPAPLTAEKLLSDCYGGEAVPGGAAHHPLAPARLVELCHAMKARGGSYVDCPTMDSPVPLSAAAAAAATDDASMVPMYVAPDGQIVSMASSTQWRPYECLFAHPQDGAAATVNLGQLVTEAKRGAPAELQPSLSLALVVCGGTSAVGGFQQRLLYEMKRYDLSMTDAHQLRHASPLIAPLHSLSHLHWTGAALASSSSAFSGLWITKAEYEEEGASVLARKLFH